MNGFRGWVLFVAVGCVAVLGACGGDSFSGGKFEPLLGLGGKQVWQLSFDGKNHPVVGGTGGLWRYTDVDGWLQVGTVDDSTMVYAQYPADGGAPGRSTASRSTSSSSTPGCGRR